MWATPRPAYSGRRDYRPAPAPQQQPRRLLRRAGPPPIYSLAAVFRRKPISISISISPPPRFPIDLQNPRERTASHPDRAAAMESDEDWVLLDSDNPADSDDDDRVLAISSDDDEDGVVGDDGEDLYDLEDAEEDEQLRPRLPKLLSGLFHHTPSGTASYAAFDALNSAKQLIPDPAFSVFPEEVTVLASTRGLVCLRGRTTGLYYIANPVTFKRVRLPSHNREHCAFGDPAVVITFDESCSDDDIDHYHVVVTFNIGDGIFVFESFSSRTWEWRVGSEICAVEHVVSASGVGALGLAFWRTTIGYILCYNPEAGCPDMIFAPPVVEHRPLWELGEMEGNLCVTCMDERVNEVAVLCLDLNPGAGEIPWAWAGQFDGCKLRNREGVTLLRSQGGAEVVMFDPQAEIVMAMDFEGRTIGNLQGGKYSAEFIPYVSSSTAISSEEAGAKCRTTAAVSETFKYAEASIRRRFVDDDKE